jgi:uncharacterized repeat protein (TIGR01451 family)
MKKSQILVLLLLLTVTEAHAYNPADVQWAPEKSATLHIDGTLTLDEYTIEAAEFPSPVEAYTPPGRYEGDVEPVEPVTPFVTLRLYKNNQLIKDDITLFGADGENNVYTTADDELRIKATDFPSPTAKEWVYEYYDPWATVSLQKRGTPEFTITIETEKDEYTTGVYTQFQTTVKLKNTGYADAKDVRLTIDTGGLPLGMGDLKAHYIRFAKDEEVEKTITLKIPVSLEEKTHNITATATGYDIKDIQYTNTGYKLITLTPPPPLTVEKSVIGSMYLKDRALLKLKVANTGNYPVYNIHLNDSVPDTFKLQTNTTLNWSIQSLPVGGEWSTSYYIKPTTPSSSGHTLPAAHARFTLSGKNYDVASNQPVIIVRGPNITLEKTVDKTTVNMGETVTVTVTATNTGDLPSRTQITDTMPAGAIHVSGELNRTKFLQKNESISYNYTIQLNTPGEITLPKVTAVFTELVYRGTVKSFTNARSPTIHVIDPNHPPPQSSEEAKTNNDKTTQEQQTQEQAGEEETPVQEEAPAQEEYVQPGFEGILAAITILLIYLWRQSS